MSTIAIIGASGAIGAAMTEALAARDGTEAVYAFSRSRRQFEGGKIISGFIDIEDEASIAEAAQTASQAGPLDLVFVASGILHVGDITPEKALCDLSAAKFQTLFAVNTIGPALAAKHFLPHLRRDRRAVFAALSARVGSITDNGFGGWYAYRASKAALNMVLKNAAIETARRSKEAIVAGLHPGTVDSALSEPFQGGVAEGKLFAPDFAAQKLIAVMDGLTPEDSGKVFAWDGEAVPA